MARPMFVARRLVIERERALVAWGDVAHVR
jgi:hypothetical protein